MNKQKLMNMVSAVRGGAPVCRAARLRPVEQNSKRELACCPFPEDEPNALLEAFRAAPQFKKIRLEDVLRRDRNGARAVLISEHPYEARQAALYLAAISAKLERDTDQASGDEYLDDMLELDFDDLLAAESEERRLKNSLLVVSASALDPDIACAGQDEKPVAAIGAGQKPLDVASYGAPALLICAGSGPVLSDTVVERLELLSDRFRDIFVSLNRSQIDQELLSELRFKHRFQLLHVLPATDDYLSGVLCAAVAEQGRTLAPDADPIAVISHLRRVRGERFDETDLYDAAAYAAQYTKNSALSTDDLRYRLYSLKPGGRSAMDELNAMTGLENVKGTLRGQLAVSILNARRGRGTGGCRNLAFAGSPGTGKSVTARLVAEILREEGCGTGRFVEVGREQLVGRYMGHTAPMIAKLFEQAKGGVLFIDEAGALIPDGHDEYAKEAVDTLVRHMELEQGTVVIFATYTDEMKRLLASNAGLSSRVARVLEFKDYTDGQLWTILGTLTEKEGFSLPEDARDVCLSFFRALRERKSGNFGNGREARRLRDAAIEALALRVMDGAQSMELTAADFDAAAKRLLEQESEEEQARRIGF